jgi:hypothetical protein
MVQDVAMAIPRVNDIPTSVHVCVIGTFVVVAGFILLFSIRLHKAIDTKTSPRMQMSETQDGELVIRQRQNKA